MPGPGPRAVSRKKIFRNCTRRIFWPFSRVIRPRPRWASIKALLHKPQIFKILLQASRLPTNMSDKEFGGKVTPIPDQEHTYKRLGTDELSLPKGKNFPFLVKSGPR